MFCRPLGLTGLGTAHTAVEDGVTWEIPIQTQGAAVVKTLTFLAASLWSLPAFAITDLPTGAIAILPVREGRIVSVERNRSRTLVELEFSLISCANDLGPVTHTLKKPGRRTILAVTAIDILNEASDRVRCAPFQHLRRKILEIDGRFSRRQLRLEMMTESDGHR